MFSNLLLIGIIGGIGLAAVALGPFFSADIATAQMMQPQQQAAGLHHPGMNHTMFSVNGMSMVQDVILSGVNITGDNQLSVNLIYTGNASSPSVTVVAMTNHMAMMNMMMDGSGYSGMMMNPNMMMAPGMMNNTGFPNMMMMNPNMMMGPGHFATGFESQTGSTVVNSGWQSGSGITIMLDGDGSAYDASCLHIMVFPHLA